LEIGRAECKPAEVRYRLLAGKQFLNELFLHTARFCLDRKHLSLEMLIARALYDQAAAQKCGIQKRASHHGKAIGNEELRNASLLGKRREASLPPRHDTLRPWRVFSCALALRLPQCGGTHPRGNWKLHNGGGFMGN
jgi:hypothetical protein